MREPYYTCCEDGMLSQVPPADHSGLCPRCRLSAIQRLIQADLDATSDEELRQELIEDGLDPEKVAADVKQSLDNVIRKFTTERVPLSEGQLFALLEGCTEHPPQRLPPGWIAFARAVERAHGIGCRASGDTPDQQEQKR